MEILHESLVEAVYLTAIYRHCFIIVFMDKYLPEPFGSLHILGTSLMNFHDITDYRLILYHCKNTIHAPTLTILFYRVMCLTNRDIITYPTIYLFMRHNHFFSI